MKTTAKIAFVLAASVLSLLGHDTTAHAAPFGPFVHAPQWSCGAAEITDNITGLTATFSHSEGRTLHYTLTKPDGSRPVPHDPGNSANWASCTPV